MSHAFEEHTAEVRLRVHAETAEALFSEVVRALAELAVDDPDAPVDGERVPLRVEARDMPALLVGFVDEVVFLSETKKKVFSRATVERVTETEVVATLEGFSPPAIRTAVKAATFYEVECGRAPDGWRASVVLDV
jgi:SHS2 domain-containing protein